MTNDHPTTIDDVIREVKSKASGRTRYEGQEPRWDEMMVAEIERLRRIVMIAMPEAAYWLSDDNAE